MPSKRNALKKLFFVIVLLLTTSARAQEFRVIQEAKASGGANVPFMFIKTKTVQVFGRGKSYTAPDGLPFTPKLGMKLSH